jgi:perosamine synthetase
VTDSRLAIDGGTPVRDTPFVTFNDAGGRTLGDEEVAAAERVIRSGMLSSTWGEETPALEREFAELIGTRHAVAASSGTASLHLAVAAVDPEPGEEIITTPISDFGTVIPILAQNCVPVFADVDPRTGIIDPDSVLGKITPRTRAIIAVHLFGCPAPVTRLREIADEHGLTLVEDCAQAYLTEPEPGRHAGGYGTVGCFSLQQTKHVTAGDGGLVVTDDPALARRMRLFADKGWPRDTGERTYEFLGMNYRMTELVAAVARAQLRKLPAVVARRRAGATRFAALVGDLPGVTLPADPDTATFWMLPVVLDPELAGGDNQTWTAALRAEGILCGPGYIPRPLHLTDPLTRHLTYGASGFPIADVDYGPGLCPVAERMVGATLFTLAWNENYTDEDVADIATAVRKVHSGLGGAR